MTFADHFAEAWDLHPAAAADVLDLVSALEVALMSVRARRGLKAWCHKLAHDAMVEAVAVTTAEQFAMLLGRSQQCLFFEHALPGLVSGVQGMRDAYHQQNEPQPPEAP